MRNDLRELFYCRNPGDARVKVGSDREAASSPDRLTARDVKIGIYHMGLCPRRPSKIGLVSGEYTPTKLIGNTWPPSTIVF